MRTSLTPEERERFDAKIEKAGPDQCWNWTSSFTSSGQPQFYLGRSCVSGNRLMYALHHGPIPADTPYVIPKCGNKRCMNPAHLVLNRTSKLRDVTAAPQPKPLPKRMPEPVARVLGRAPSPTGRPTALSEAVLGALDALTALDADAIGRELAACEARLITLKTLLQLTSLTSRSVRTEVVPADPLRPVRAPAPARPKSGAAAKKAPAPKSAAGPGAGLARRMAFFLASSGPRTITDLAAAMAATPTACARLLKGDWFALDRDKYDVTDAGRAVALEGNP